MTRKKFDQVGMLAIEPTALALEYAQASPNAEPTTSAQCAEVMICGPLMSRADMFFDGYDAIVARVKHALAGPADVVIMRIDSPGGLVSGCLAASRAIRRAADASGKRLIAYVDESATSAAYALACAAHEIATPSTGRIGSIGVIEVLQSFARQANAQGVDFTVITSGERKGDGNPAVAMTDDARAALQLGVDRMAEAFFELVEEHRPNLMGKVAGLQAGIYYGQDAIKIGLADTLLDYESLKVALTSPKENGSMTRAEIKAGLKALAEGSGEDAEAAKRMLAADEAPPPENKEEEEPEAKAAAPEEEEPKAAAAVARVVAPLAKAVGTLAGRLDAQAKADAKRAKEEREALIASRPDVSKAVFDALAGASNDSLRAALAALPVPNPAADATVVATLGDKQGNAHVSRLTPAQAAAADRLMGLSSRKFGIKEENGIMQLGAEVE